jgi:predicted dehydrogenase/NADPH:quinone reductase-like Zn-dependent oxidoreductase
MKQALLSLRSGAIQLVDVPRPAPRAGHVLIRTRCSVVSPGTERMLLEFGRSGLIDKVRSQPEKARQVVDKVLRDGLVPTLDAVQAKLDQPLPLGYCNAGEVIAVGAGIADLVPGDRVVSNGGHAEVVSVPRNLCAKIPQRPDGGELAFADAAFTVLGAIALQGVRLAMPTLGERLVVTGMGLVGLLAAQIVRAAGCNVLGVDISEHRLELARRLGIETYCAGPGGDPVRFAREWSRQEGVDAVIVAASTDSSQPMTDAAEMCRKRGRIVQLGLTGLDLNRRPLFDKELTVQVSCSYGPGRYDPDYEDAGHDYPLGYVRWTERRNFEAMLELIAGGRVDVASLVTDRLPFERAERAWELVSESDSLGIILEYPGSETAETATIAIASARPVVAGGPRVALIGAGNYASRTLLPALRDAGISPVVIAAPGGLSAALSGRAFGAARATSDVDAAISSTDVDTVMIATRHDSHADLVCRALAAGKHVFVEKPLCTTPSDLARIREAHERADRLLMVGFNRRWAPHVRQASQLLSAVPGPRTAIFTINAGELPHSHWTHDPVVGAGRIIGEACHFIDLARFLCGPFMDVRATPLRGHTDTTSITISHQDGSISTIIYVATGHPRFPKERIEVFAGGRIVAIDNFRRLHAHGWPLRAGAFAVRQDKGQRDMMQAFVDAVRAGGPAPVAFDEIEEVTNATFTAAGMVDA